MNKPQRVRGFYVRILYMSKFATLQNLYNIIFILRH